MRGGSPAGTLWSNIVIDVAKNMLGFGLTNLGNVNIGANQLQTTTCMIRDVGAVTLALRNLANTAYGDFAIGEVSFNTGVRAMVNALYLQTLNVDTNYLTFRARDTGVGTVEVARLQGEADPEFRCGNNGNALRATYAGWLGLYGVPPVARQNVLSIDLGGGTDIDDVCRAKVQQLIVALRNTGIIS